jgi:hypothetical protein
MKTKVFSFRVGICRAFAGIGTVAILGGCIPSQEALGYKQLPLHNQVQNGTRGALAIVHVEFEKVAGELIAIDAERVYLLQGSEETVVQGQLRILRRIKRSEISHMDLVFARNPDGVKELGTLAYITLPSHLLYAFLTVPFNLLWVKSTIAYDHGAFRLKDITAEEARKFARFPQGLPAGMSFEQLKKSL